MAVVSGVTLKVLINQYDVTGYFRKLDLAAQRGMYDSTVFGSTSKAFIPGLKAGTVGLEGLFEASATAGSPDAVFTEIEAAAIVPLVSVFPEGWAVGKRAYLLQAHENKHDIGAQVDALILNSAEFTDNDGYDFGVSLHALTPETSLPFTGTAVNNGAATTNGGVGFLHVTAIAGVSPRALYTIQHSTNNSVWADLIVFGEVDDDPSTEFQRVVVSPGTTIRQYLRITITENGTTSSVTGSCSFARR